MSWPFPIGLNLIPQAANIHWNFTNRCIFPPHIDKNFLGSVYYFIFSSNPQNSINTFGLSLYIEFSISFINSFMDSLLIKLFLRAINNTLRVPIGFIPNAFAASLADISSIIASFSFNCKANAIVSASPISTL